MIAGPGGQRHDQGQGRQRRDLRQRPPFQPGLSPEFDSDTIKGGGGNDTIFGDEKDETISGGRGDDFIVGYYGDVTGNNLPTDTDDLNGGPGDDTLVGDAVADGNIDAANDVLRGGDGDDVMYGDSRSFKTCHRTRRSAASARTGSSGKPATT